MRGLSDDDAGATVAYRVEDYQALIEQHRVRAERGFAHKQAAELQGAGGRARQRAYFDAFRDLAAPALRGHLVIRVASPEEGAGIGLARLRDCLTLAGLRSP